MKRLVSFVVAAVLAAPVVLAQPVHFNIQCLSQAQQDEIKAKAQAHSHSVTVRKINAQAAAGSATDMARLREERDAAQAAMFQCISQAQAAGQVPGDVCKASFDAFSAASVRHDQLADARIQAARKFEEEDRNGLRALRAQYPACPETLLPDNAVIRK